MAFFEKLLHLFSMHSGAVIVIPFISSIILLFSILFYRFMYPKKTIAPLVLVTLIAIPPVLNLFRPGTYQSGDLSLHAEYLRAFYQNLSYGIVVPRWAADFCAGNGCPVFLISYVLAYYFGSLFHFIGFSYVDSIKIVLAFSYIFSGVFMYLFMKEEVSTKAGIIAAIFYLFSPFHLIDLHFRGSVGEVLSYTFIPLVFLFSRRFIINPNIQNFLLTAFSAIFLLYSHSVTTVSIIPFLLGYNLFLVRKTYKHFFTKQLFILLLSYLTGVLLSTYYWLPAFIESKYTWAVRYGPTNYFEPIQNYLFSPVGFGFLFQGHRGEYRLIIGYPHLIVVLTVLYLLIFKRHIFNKYIKSVLLLSLAIFFIYFLLMQTYAKPIWDTFLFLDFFLMVWRLLVSIGFITAVIAGIIISKIKNTKIIITICFLTIVSTMLNWGNRVMVPYNPNNYYTHVDEYTEYTEVGNPFYDKIYKQKMKYFSALSSLRYRAKYPLETLSGKIDYKELDRTPQSHEYVIAVEKPSDILENTYYFPGWEVFANNKKIPINYKNLQAIDKITFSLPKGLYKIDVIFSDTPLEKLANSISVDTLIALVGIISYIKIYTKKNYYSGHKAKKKQ